MSRFLLALGVCVALLVPATAGAAGVVDTVHNLSATGPGAVKAPGVGEGCVFCPPPHTPPPRAPPARPRVESCPPGQALYPCRPLARGAHANPAQGGVPPLSV